MQILKCNSATENAKKKQKIVEDKTFGLKNKKKSAKVAKFVQQMEEQAGTKKRESDRINQKKQKLQDEKAKKEMNDLFKPVIVQPKVPFGKTTSKLRQSVMFCLYQCISHFH